MDPKKEIDDLLETIGKDRRWLAEQSGYSYYSVRDCLAPDGKKLSPRMHAALKAAIEKHLAASEAESAAAPQLPDRLTIEAHPRIVAAWDAAAKGEGQTTKEWAIQELNRAAAAWRAIQQRDNIRVAETPPPQQTGTDSKP